MSGWLRTGARSLDARDTALSFLIRRIRRRKR